MIGIPDKSLLNFRFARTCVNKNMSWTKPVADNLQMGLAFFYYKLLIFENKNQGLLQIAAFYFLVACFINCYLRTLFVILQTIFGRENFHGSPRVGRHLRST